MLYGGVNYRLKADPENDVYIPWAGRVVFAPQQEGEGVKMQFYQVYLVSASYNRLIGTLLTGLGPVRAIRQEISDGVSFKEFPSNDLNNEYVVRMKSIFFKVDVHFKFLISNLTY